MCIIYIISEESHLYSLTEWSKEGMSKGDGVGEHEEFDMIGTLERCVCVCVYLNSTLDKYFVHCIYL